MLLLTKTDMLGSRLDKLRQQYTPRNMEIDSSEEESVSNDSYREEKLIKSWHGGSQHDGSNISSAQPKTSEAQDDMEGPENELEMMVELLEGNFAEKIGFSGKAMAVSSHTDRGVFDALAGLVKLAVLFEAQKNEDENERGTATATNIDRLGMPKMDEDDRQNEMPEVGRRSTIEKNKKIKLEAVKH